MAGRAVERWAGEARRKPEQLLTRSFAVHLFSASIGLRMGPRLPPGEGGHRGEEGASIPKKREPVTGCC